MKRPKLQDESQAGNLESTLNDLARQTDRIVAAGGLTATLAGLRAHAAVSRTVALCLRLLLYMSHAFSIFEVEAGAALPPVVAALRDHGGG